MTFSPTRSQVRATLINTSENILLKASLLPPKITCRIYYFMFTRKNLAIARLLQLIGWVALSLSTPVRAKELSKVDLNLHDLSGKRVHLRDLRGKIVVLNFWATWCGPCREEMPRLAQAEKDYKAKNVVFIGVSLDDSKAQAKIPEFLHEQQIEFPIWIGATGDDLDKLDMGPAVPATAFIDPAGRIVARASGEIRPDELKERLDWLANGEVGPAPKDRIVHLEPH